MYTRMLAVPKSIPMSLDIIIAIFLLSFLNPFPHPIGGMCLAYLSIRKPRFIQGAKYQFLLYTKDLCF